MTKARFTTKIGQIFRLVRWLTLHPLNRENKLHAISRFMRWQIAARLLPEAIFGLPFVNDSVLLVQKGMVDATGNWYSGLDEVHEMGFIAHVLSDGDLFIDIGANIGSYTVLAAAACSCKVICIERKVNGVATNQVMTSENLIFTRDLRRVEELISSCGDRKIKVSNGYV